jgi:hypothetical protein
MDAELFGLRITAAPRGAFFQARRRAKRPAPATEADSSVVRTFHIPHRTSQSMAVRVSNAAVSAAPVSVSVSPAVAGVAAIAIARPAGGRPAGTRPAAARSSGAGCDGRRVRGLTARGCPGRTRGRRDPRRRNDGLHILTVEFSAAFYRGPASADDRRALFDNYGRLG